jgi:hypothetical protein
MNWLWQERRSRPLEQRQGKLRELDEAKEILEEIFGISRAEVDEMIRMRLVEGLEFDQNFDQQ